MIYLGKLKLNDCKATVIAIAAISFIYTPAASSRCLQFPLPIAY
jgi:hypothetical protein